MKFEYLSLVAMLLVCSPCLFGQTGYPGGKWQPGPAQYGHIIIENEYALPLNWVE